MWILYNSIIALTVNLVLGYFLYMFVINGIDVHTKLYVNDEDATDIIFEDRNHTNSSGRKSPMPLIAQIGA